MKLYYRIMLQNYITESYDRIMLQKYIADLYHGYIYIYIYYGRYVTAGILRHIYIMADVLWQIYYGRHTMADMLWQILRQIRCVPSQKQPYFNKCPAPAVLKCGHCNVTPEGLPWTVLSIKGMPKSRKCLRAPSMEEELPT